MNSVLSAVKDTVPISLFNKGRAGQVFSEVKKTGAKVVMKNNEPECVLLSPEEYQNLFERISDMELIATAEERLARHPDQKDWIPEQDVLKQLGISEKDLEGWEDIDIE